MTVFAREVLRLRRQAGMTQQVLASACHTTHSNISQIENGRRGASFALVTDLDKVFGTGGVLAQLWADPAGTPLTALQQGAPDMDRRDMLTGLIFMTSHAAIATELPPDTGRRDLATTMTGHIGAADVAVMRAQLEALRAVDEQFGGTRGAQALAGLFDEIAVACQATFACDKVRSQVLTIAAETAFLRAWKGHDSHDAKHQGFAQREFRRAQVLAEESLVPGHDAWLLRAQALQACDIGQRDNAVALAEAAVKRAVTIGGHTLALMRIALARAAAETGDHALAREQIRAAQPQLNTHTDTDTPEFVAAWCPHKANLLTQTGHALSAMGDHGDAVDYYTTARDLWNPYTHARVYAMDTYLVGKAHFDVGDYASAETQWMTALGMYASIDSQRCRDRAEAITAAMPHLASVA